MFYSCARRRASTHASYAKADLKPKCARAGGAHADPHVGERQQQAIPEDLRSQTGSEALEGASVSPGASAAGCKPAAHTSGEAAGAKCRKGTVGPRSCVVHPIRQSLRGSRRPGIRQVTQDVPGPVFQKKARFSCGTRRRYSPRIVFAIAALGRRIIWCAWPRLPDCLAAHAAEPFPLA